jgi:peptide/nickel transport system substrate-binding protein
MLVVALVALVACEPARRRTPDDTIVVLVEAPMTTSDPRFTILGLDGKLGKLVNRGLTVVDSDTLEPRLALASKIERVDDLTYDVELRPDARFSDGEPVLARDVAGTYTYMLDPSTEGLFHKTLAERYHRVESRAERTVRFHLKTKLATLMSDLDFGIVSFAHGTPAPHRAIGAGPYLVRELTSTHVVLDRNPYYAGAPQPRVPHVEIKFVRDAAARLLMLAGGSADLVQNATRLDLIDEVATQPRVRVVEGRSVFLTYLLLNNEDPALRDLRVRQAIALALDRPAIIAAKFSGRAQLATGLLPPWHPWYAHGATRWSRDLPRAAALLEAAGYPARGGVRLRLTYKTSSDAFRVAIARTIAAQLADVGIDVDVRPFEFATFFTDVKRGNYQLASMQTAEITEPDFYFTYFHSSWIPTKSNPDGYNRWRYRSAEVDRLTEEGRRELDLDKRKAIYDRLQRIVADDLPVVPLFHEDNVALVNLDLQGYTITPNARLIGLVGATKVVAE